jgi:hypothetical protein
MLFDYIKKRKNQYWIAGMILILDIGVESKYKLGKKLLKNEEVFDFFVGRLFGGGNVS